MLVIKTTGHLIYVEQSFFFFQNLICCVITYFTHHLDVKKKYCSEACRNATLQDREELWQLVLWKLVLHVLPYIHSLISCHHSGCKGVMMDTSVISAPQLSALSKTHTCRNTTSCLLFDVIIWLFAMLFSSVYPQLCLGGGDVMSCYKSKSGKILTFRTHR